MQPLEKVINLAKKNGDKLVILDNQGNPEYVIMSFDQYEQLSNGKKDVRDLTEGELLTKINCDITALKESSESEDLDNLAKNVWSEAVNEDISLNLDDFEDNKVEIEDEDQYYFEPVE